MVARQVDILLAVPARLEALLAEGELQLGGVRHLIFDEADKLFDLKLALHVDTAIAACSHPHVVSRLVASTRSDLDPSRHHRCCYGAYSSQLS